MNKEFWSRRLRNKAFWVSFCSSALMLLQLLEVDLEFIQSKGCKTYTPIVITNLESDKKVKFNLGDVVAKESIVMELV